MIKPNVDLRSSRQPHCAFHAIGLACLGAAIANGASGYAVAPPAGTTAAAPPDSTIFLLWQGGASIAAAAKGVELTVFEADNLADFHGFKAVEAKR